MIDMQRQEKARLALQLKLDAAKSQSERNRLGQFATPPVLAKDIVAAGLTLLPSRSGIRFLDPGFGTGSFFSTLLSTVPRSRIEAAEGFEIDPHYGEAARELWNATCLKLHLADFTRAVPPQADQRKSNLVICNPPYVRHHHLDQEQKRLLRTATARYLDLQLNGLSGLYCYFMVLSASWMSKDGVAAWLVPSEFMDVNYGKEMKRFLLERVTLLRIHRFDLSDVQFEDALVSSAVVFLRNSPPPAEHEVEFTVGGSVATPQASERIAVRRLRQFAKWTRLAERGVTSQEQQTCGTLGDLFAVKRGLATGCNEFFMLSPEQVRENAIPEQFLKPVLPGPRDLDVDEIEADEHGVPKLTNRFFLLDCGLSQEQVQSEHPSLWKYLQRGIAAGIDQRYLCRHRQPWYSQERRSPAPFLCTYMGRPTRKSNVPFRFILNRSQATAANVYLMLYPKPSLASALKGDPSLGRAIRASLASLVAETLTREGRFYGGGLYKIEPRELANVPADALLNVLPMECQVPRQMELFGE